MFWAGRVYINCKYVIEVIDCYARLGLMLTDNTCLTVIRRGRQTFVNALILQVLLCHR